MPFVTISILEIYQLDIAIGRQLIIKLPSKVIIVKYQCNFIQQLSCL